MVVNGILSNLEPYRILEILEGTKKYNIKIDKSKFYIAIATKNGIYTKQHELKKMEIDVNKCYNDDIPYERVKEILSKDGKSLILFYGEPGTGKTTLIKKLINEVERKFIFMDASVVTNISDNDFIDFLSDNAGSVIVLEDCEKMLVSREQSNNQTIGTVLNLTDGIIGESFEVKFICTFNSDLKFVDDAILRKGRLSLKYEFKKLPVEKVRAIYPDATGEMTLADAYDATEENDFSKVERGEIGF
jgi:SpoVK/Ycf46/Vps4 family AAA+-type ATPase